MSQEIETFFPRLRGSLYKVTSPPTKKYNCIAWAAGDSTRWWWPTDEYYWPESVSRMETVEVFVLAFQAIGFEVCRDTTLEAGWVKIALYARKDGSPTHAARQLPDGAWTSKLGGIDDIQHEKPDDVGGESYGEVVRIMRRPSVRAISVSYVRSIGLTKEISVPSLFQLGYYWDAKIFLTSVKLDIYTALSEGWKSADEISASIKTDLAFTQRLLSALVVIGVITCDGERYNNTPIVAEFLVKTSPFYMGELMLLQDAEWDAWGNLEDIIRSGKPRVTGNLFMNRPDLAELTLNVLHRMGQRIAPSLAEKIDLSQYRSFLDVGGGAGTFSIAFCKRYPNLSSVLFDLPQTLPITRKSIEKEKMEDRITLVGGDFNKDPFPEAVGSGLARPNAGRGGIGGSPKVNPDRPPHQFDVVFLSDILHYQTSAENQALFHKLYETVNPMGMIIVKDMFLGEEGAPGWNAIFSMHMMVYSQKGQCFKGSEVTAWLEKAGFKEIREVERNTVFIAKK
ncbi:MAG: hypothetical protein HY201_02860 [Nitrospirae bacterium]|nr:hypothetical protein [Candidatus Troglogloeales bacterium]